MYLGDTPPSLPPLPKKAKPEHLPSDDLSPRLKKIISRDYDYPYRKGHEYVQGPIDRRKQVDDDNYDAYTAKALQLGRFTGGSGDYYFGKDPQMAELAAKISAGQDISDLDLEAVKDRINNRYSNIDSTSTSTLLDQACGALNLRAVDKLFKHGASPYVPFDNRRNTPSYRDFFDDMWNNMHPGFSTDVTRLYVSYGFDPNYPNNDWGTFLGSMISLENELGWVALMEAGGNPWARAEIVGTEKSIAADAASSYCYEFIDYMLWKRHYFTDPHVKPEWVYGLLNRLINYIPSEIQESQRRVRAILELTRLKPTDKVLEFINYKPKPPEPEGYGDSPKFN